MHVTAMLAEFIAKSRFEDCPPTAVEAARRAIMDCLGVMLAGSTEPAARIVQAVAQVEGGTPWPRSSAPGAGQARSGPRLPTAPRPMPSTSTTPTSP